MDARFTVPEKRLLHALKIAILSCPPGALMDYAAVKNCMRSLETHYLIGNPSRAFQRTFCDFTGSIVHKGERIATLRINYLGYAKVMRQQRVEAGFELTRVDRRQAYMQRRMMSADMPEIQFQEVATC